MWGKALTLGYHQPTKSKVCGRQRLSSPEAAGRGSTPASSRCFRHEPKKICRIYASAKIAAVVQGYVTLQKPCAKFVNGFAGGGGGHASPKATLLRWMRKICDSQAAEFRAHNFGHVICIFGWVSRALLRWATTKTFPRRKHVTSHTSTNFTKTDVCMDLFWTPLYF